MFNIEIPRNENASKWPPPFPRGTGRCGGLSPTQGPGGRANRPIRPPSKTAPEGNGGGRQYRIILTMRNIFSHPVNASFNAPSPWLLADVVGKINRLYDRYLDASC